MSQDFLNTQCIFEILKRLQKLYYMATPRQERWIERKRSERFDPVREAAKKEGEG